MQKIELQHGERFGRLTVMGPAPPFTQPSGIKVRAWWMRCDCGRKTRIRQDMLRSGRSTQCRWCGYEHNVTKAHEALRSCGYPGVQKAQEACTTHGHTKGHSSTPTYNTWTGMKRRCFNPTSVSYPYYGARGITVCTRWRDSFEAFLDDMGERPPNTSIDRIDPNGNYEPGNCRWATSKEQRHNRRVRAA